MSNRRQLIPEKKPGFLSDFVKTLLTISAFGSCAHPDVQKALLGFSDDSGGEDRGEHSGAGGGRADREGEAGTRQFHVL